MKTEKETNKTIDLYSTKKVLRRSCSNCKFFKSFKDAYFDDMEPDDVGFCRNGNSPRYGNKGANSGYVCDFHNYS